MRWRWCDFRITSWRHLLKKHKTWKTRTTSCDTLPTKWSVLLAPAQCTGLVLCTVLFCWMLAGQVWGDHRDSQEKTRKQKRPGWTAQNFRREEHVTNSSQHGAGGGEPTRVSLSQLLVNLHMLCCDVIRRCGSCSCSAHSVTSSSGSCRSCRWRPQTRRSALTRPPSRHSATPTSWPHCNARRRWRSFASLFQSYRCASSHLRSKHALQDYHLSTSRVVVHAKLSSFDRCRPCARRTHSCWKTSTTSAAPSQSRVSAKASKSCAILSHTTCFCVNWTRCNVI